MNTKLKVSEISKIYPGCIANDKVSLEFGSGKIYALLGENGAGKYCPKFDRQGLNPEKTNKAPL